MFKNRKEAGIALGKALDRYRASNPVVLAIPRGGVETGYYVANYLESDFDIIVTRKLGYPYQPEAAFGAIAEDGSLYLNPWNKRFISQTIIGSVSAKEREEINRRIDRYRGGHPLKSLENRVVILVDDGIATGATLWAAIRMCKKRNPRKLIVAAPVASLEIRQRLKKEVSDVVVLEMPDNYYAVSQVYEEFNNLNDNDVIRFIRKWKLHQKKAANTSVP